VFAFMRRYILLVGLVVRSQTTAWRHERLRGIATEPGRVQLDPVESDGPGGDAYDINESDAGAHSNDVAMDVLPAVFEQQPPVTTATLAARETLALIASRRVLETGALSMNKIYDKYYSPSIPEQMRDELPFGSVLNEYVGQRFE